MANERTTIMLNSTVYKRVQEHVDTQKKLGEKISLTSFISKALINQLENEGDFEIRDIYEGDIEDDTID